MREKELYKLFRFSIEACLKRIWTIYAISKETYQLSGHLNCPVSTNAATFRLFTVSSPSRQRAYRARTNSSERVAGCQDRQFRRRAWSHVLFTSTTFAKSSPCTTYNTANPNSTIANSTASPTANMAEMAAFDHNEGLDLSLTSPGTPLNTMSPERANQQNALFSSPRDMKTFSPNGGPIRHHIRGSSDVQGKVALFSNLATNRQGTSEASLERRRADQAALKRAVLGREEAEGDTRKAREETSRLRNKVEEGRERERRLAERFETVIVSLCLA
jgi:hypothetical protein